MKISLRERIRYELSYSISERIERGKDSLCLKLARRMPARLIKWAIVVRHAELTRGDVHPASVSAFDLYKETPANG